MALNLNDYVKHIKVETAYLPTLDMPNPFLPGPPNPLLQALKPKITVTLEALGQTKDVVSSPYGDPGPSKWPTIQNLLLLAAVGTLGYFAFRRLIR